MKYVTVLFDILILNSLLSQNHFVCPQLDHLDIITFAPEPNVTTESSRANVTTTASTTSRDTATSATTPPPTSALPARTTAYPWMTHDQNNPTISPLTTPRAVLVTLAPTVNSTGSGNVGNSQELTLQACCRSKCVTFDNLMSMVGLQCCGDTPINAFEKICCNNKIHVRNAGGKYFDRCCSDRPYAWDQVCCRGKVYDGVPQASCCGDIPYSIYDRTSICCADRLHKIPPNTGSAVCCGEHMYDDRAATHFCCGDSLYSRLTHNGCCHPFPGVGVEYPVVGSVVGSSSSNAVNAPSPSVPGQRPVQFGTSAGKAEGYNSTKQMCCDRVYDKQEFDFCCYVADINAKQWSPPAPRPYSSKTHCCDGMTVLEMDPKTKTCLQR